MYHGDRFAYSLFNIKNVMHGTCYNFKIFLDLYSYIQPCSNNNTTLREASTLLIQHVCVILAFAIVHPKHTVRSSLNAAISANPRQSFDS